MTEFSQLASQYRHILAAAILLATLGLLALCLYRLFASERTTRTFFDALIFAFSVCLLSYITASSDDPVRYPSRIPWASIAGACAGILIYCVLGMLYESKKHRSSLSPDSIKQALDDLDSGVCFADRSGRIVLINRAMLRFSYELIGAYPRMIYELGAALEESVGGSTLRRLADGRMMRLCKTELDDPAGFTQMSAQDVTELYDATLRLEDENEKLRRTNEKMREMYAMLADGIREEETLRLKMRIHDDIGASLIAISEMIGKNGEASGELGRLQNAIGYFTAAKEACDSFDEVSRRAAQMGVELVVDFASESERDIALIAAAVRECVTNCARHAHGHTVTATLEERGGRKFVTFTNDGDPPNGEITEGGGLSSLRKAAEREGASMRVMSSPRFALEIGLPTEEKE